MSALKFAEFKIEFIWKLFRIKVNKIIICISKLVLLI